MCGRRVFVVVLGAVVFLLPAGASGGGEVPSVGTVTPIIYGTQGANGWFVTNVTVNWAIQPLPYLQSEGCDTRTVTTDTVGIDLTCHVWWADGDISATVTIRRDATAPVLGALSVKPGNRKAHLRWRAPQDASSVELARAPGLKGAAESVVFRGTALARGYVDRGLRPGRNYVYRLTAADAAANQATKTLEFVGRGALLYPAPGEHVSRPPLLVWEAVKGASYYNVVLVRGRRVFSAWPLKARLRLPRAWTYRGRRYKLRPGTYSWFVWPGRGPLSAGQYGRSLGGSTFTFEGALRD